MNYRSFGRTGWQTSEIGYGMWGMAGWTGADDEQSLSSLHLAVELGCNFFDTAYAYGEGHSERLLGETVRRHRDKRLYTATKIPPKNRKWPSERGCPLADAFPARLHPPDDGEEPGEPWAWTAWTCNNSTYGRTPGRTTNDGNARWRT